MKKNRIVPAILAAIAIAMGFPLKWHPIYIIGCIAVLMYTTLGQRIKD